MLVFVDESGDHGMRGKTGSSARFTIAATLFADKDEAFQSSNCVDEVRKMLGFRQEFEFKFNKSDRRVRETFLGHIVQSQFFYSAVVLNKAKLWGPGFRYSESFYKYTAGLVFQNLTPYLESATVVIDGSGTRQFRRELCAYLRKRMNVDDGPSKIKDVHIRQSRGNNLLQHADMVCGAIARSYRDDKADRQRYRQIIKARELSVQVWPK